LCGIYSINTFVLQTLEHISFQDIAGIPQLIKDFLRDDLPEFSGITFSKEHLNHKIPEKQKSFSADQRNILSEVMKAQHSALTLYEKQKFNLKSIGEENTFTITTGHQLNLFTGPVFFIYKILQTIKLAENCKNIFPDHHFVPVFWMATEDHDFDEINHFRTTRNYYEISAKSGGAVGRIILEDLSFIDEFESEFKDSVYGTELILMMKKAYQKGRTLSEATRILVQEIFGEYGLLILDGDDSRLKSEMQETFKSELLGNALFENSQEKVEFLRSKYGKVQVNPREINLFYLSETRNRIEKIGDKFQILDTNFSFTEEEILNELQEHPERFSPNALMRPVYQETILPNLCYIGGNAEVMYWLELFDYFERLSLPFPVLLPRNSMLFLSEKNLKKMNNLGLKIQDFFKNFAELTKDFVLNDNEILSLLNNQEKLLKEHFDKLKTKASETDKTFFNLVEAEEKRQLKSFDKMRKRLLRAEKMKNSEKLERMEELFLEVHPCRNWQERVFNFSVFFAEEGKEWLQNCYSEMNAEQSEMIIFSF